MALGPKEYEILLPGTIIEYKLYSVDGTDDREVRKRGKIVSFNEKLRKYHVADKLGKSWTIYGFYYVHPSDVRKVIDEDND